MILGSHNSWSYLPAKKWWMSSFKFIAKCQSRTIVEQYMSYNIRCFDLRVRFNKKGNLILAHGFMEYKYTKEELFHDLGFVNFDKHCYIRILHEARNKKQHTVESISYFIEFCKEIQKIFPNIHFWCGRNLYNWKIDYKFDEEPSCEEKYSSVCSPKIIDDWWPWLYAFRNNKKIIKEGTDKDILLIDFINYGH